MLSIVQATASSPRWIAIVQGRSRDPVGERQVNSRRTAATLALPAASTRSRPASLPSGDPGRTAGDVDGDLARPHVAPVNPAQLLTLASSGTPRRRSEHRRK
ncbi:MAG: hypothetical protein IPF60_20490 [Betaproteobacteria bacterium]|nr:hypothetical protein [Betaproteobacteria bacterium]